MSGTSLDGLDIAYISFHLKTHWDFDIIEATTIPYSLEWLKTLKGLMHNSRAELNDIDKTYTAYLGDTIQKFITDNNITSVDAVCSHGHTALHNPGKGYTYQIGNKKELASILNKKIVCDFRVEDVDLGGQGAPLVPIGDRLLFASYDFCLNLGGFANISSEENGSRLAYDICPVNIVLNHYVGQLGLDYDDEGKIASKGIIHKELLKELNALDFYLKVPPKSLGIEWVKEYVFPLIAKYNLETKTILCTFVAHIAHQIAKQVNNKQNAKVLVTGGGVFNLFLMQSIKALTNNEIIVPSREIVEFKEALIFGLLGVLKLRGDVNCLSSVTGASKDHSSGLVFTP